MKRKEFIQSLLGTSAAFALPFGKNHDDPDVIGRMMKETSMPVSGEMVGFKSEPIEKVRVGVIGLGNRGSVLLEMFPYLIENDQMEIAALADIDPAKATDAIEKVGRWQKRKPVVYTANKDDWKNLARQDDVDLILICTPWELHTPMALFGMRQGKHVASEVPIAYSLEDCWSLVKTAEETRRHCIMIENCCYNEEEMFVLNMIENGVFGDISHAEGAYLHDLRAHMLSTDYYKDQWRIKHHVHRNGNFYTTHGLGPISFYLKIGRGDTFSHLTSMSSRELNLSRTAKEIGSPFTEIRCGDMNTTLIRTEKGKTIMLQFDVHTGRPYSRINKVVGTKAVHDGYPSRLYVDGSKPEFSGHQWMPEEEYESYKLKYMHPVIKKLKSISENFRQGHGGMDFVMMYRLITALNMGLPLDINVYDSVMWSAVTPMSELSVASKSISLPFPDFTGGAWKTHDVLEVNQY